MANPFVHIELQTGDTEEAKIILVRVASLEDPGIFQPDIVVFADRAQPWNRVDLNIPGHRDEP